MFIIICSYFLMINPLNAQKNMINDHNSSIIIHDKNGRGETEKDNENFDWLMEIKNRRKNEYKLGINSEKASEDSKNRKYFVDIIENEMFKKKIIHDNKIRCENDTTSGNVNYKEPEIISIKAYVEDNPENHLKPPEIYSIFGEIDNDYKSKNQTLIDKNSTKKIQDDVNFKELNKSRAKENGFDEFQNESKFDWEEKWKTNYDLEKESNHSIMESIEIMSRRLKDDKTAESHHDGRIINTFKKVRSDERKSKGNLILLFEEIPNGESYRIRDFKLSDGAFRFNYLKKLLSFFEPDPYPIGLFRDILWKKHLSFNVLVQSLKIEAGFISSFMIGFIISLIIPVSVFVKGCSVEEDYVEFQGCKKKSITFLLGLIVILIGLGLATMFVTNHHISEATKETIPVISTGLSDISKYASNTQKQFSYVVMTAFDKTVSSITFDLDDIEDFLAIPIQGEIVKESGIDEVYDSAVKLASLSFKITKEKRLKMQLMKEIEDIKTELDEIKDQCSYRDRHLCQLIDSSEMKEEYVLDRHLFYMEGIANNVIQLIEEIKLRFEYLSQMIEKQTKDTKSGIKTQLEERRAILDRSLKPIKNVAYELKMKTENGQILVTEAEETVLNFDLYRWILQLVIPVMILAIWLALLMSLIFGYYNIPGLTRIGLIGSVFMICMFSTIIVIVAGGIFVIGGHFEIYGCRALYDEPDFNFIREIFDEPGIFYQKGGGFLANFLNFNQSFNVPMRDFLVECRNNRPFYNAFRIDRTSDIESIANHRNWESFQSHLHHLNVNLTRFQLLNVNLKKKLDHIIDMIAIEETKPNKNLNLLSTHLEQIARGIEDELIGLRIRNLVNRIRRLSYQDNNGRLPQDDLIQQLKSLETEMEPLKWELHRKLTNLKTIQNFINNQGAIIAGKKVKDYVNRLTNYLDGYLDYVIKALSDYVSPCTPLWEVFNAFRLQLCQHLIDPLNLFWFSTIVCFLLLAATIPITLKLSKYYSQNKDNILPGINGESSTSIDTQTGGNWATSETSQSDGW